MSRRLRLKKCCIDKMLELREKDLKTVFNCCNKDFSIVMFGSDSILFSYDYNIYIYIIPDNTVKLYRDIEKDFAEKYIPKETKSKRIRKTNKTLKE